MKRIINDKIKPYLALPNGVTITIGGSSGILNDAILEMPEIKKLAQEKKIRIVEETQ